MFFLTITMLAILSVISPGPDFIVVSNNSLNYSRYHGMQTALGIAISNLFHATYCIVGFSFIASHLNHVIKYVKYLGVAYLIYLGISLFLKKKFTRSNNQKKGNNDKSSLLLAIRQGMLCNGLNPSTTLFFISIYSFIASKGLPLITQIGYGFEIALLHCLWFSFIAYSITHKIILSRLLKIQQLINYTMGIALIVFAFLIAKTHFITP